VIEIVFRNFNGGFQNGVLPKGKKNFLEPL